MTQTFANLERLCASKNVCCERRGRAIHLTIPSGASNREVLVQSRPVARGFLDKQLWPLLKGGTQ